MKPTKLCKAIECIDCKHYKECLESEYDRFKEQGKYSALELRNNIKK